MLRDGLAESGLGHLDDFFSAGGERLEEACDGPVAKLSVRRVQPHHLHWRERIKELDARHAEARVERYAAHIYTEHSAAPHEPNSRRLRKFRVEERLLKQTEKRRRQLLQR